MSAGVTSIISRGSADILVDVECHLSNSLPGIVIVGSGSRSVVEAKERIRGAFTASHLPLPRKRITINLAPADVPKESSSLDLPMAVAILQASNGSEVSHSSQGVLQVHKQKAIFIGELSLDGRIRPVRGIIGKLLGARKQGFECFFIPQDNLQQALIVPGITILPAATLEQVAAHLQGSSLLSPIKSGDGKSALSTAGTAAATDRRHPVIFNEIAGQTQAKRALQIAAAGGHNILLNGPPGTGKSMLAQALASILPALSHEEMLEVTHLHSLGSHEYDKLVTTRPVRSPHHSASHIAITGGGNIIRPGEISLAHRGILFFDELPEFRRDTIEALRQPLENKTITITRAKESASFPANFIFVATANPCPCGYYTPGPSPNSYGPDVHTTHPSRDSYDSVHNAYNTANPICNCPPAIISQYQQKLSGPLLDRIDLVVTVEPIRHDQLLATSTENLGDERTGTIKLVLSARRHQSERYPASEQLNSDMTNHDIKQYANLTPEAVQLLNQAAGRLGLSARGYMRCIKVARTIADLADSEHIAPHHITEALSYRPPAPHRKL